MYIGENDDLSFVDFSLLAHFERQTTYNTR